MRGPGCVGLPLIDRDRGGRVARWRAPPAITSATPRTSSAVGLWVKTTTPLRVAVAGNRKTMSAQVARATRALVSSGPRDVGEQAADLGVKGRAWATCRSEGV